jgi:DNA-binding NarL/FixJ family response regulator
MTAAAVRVSEAFEQPGDEPVRVLVADRDGLARRMIQNALHDAEGIVTLPAARDVREALGHTRYYRPRVLILDTGLAPDGCVELIGKVRHAAPQTRIVTVSAEEDHTALAALRAGAVGHLSKDLDPGDLARLVAMAADGEAIVPRRLIMPLLGLLHEAPQAGWRPVRSRLTSREWEIVDQLAEHASTERIAQRLVVSPTTVYSHVKSVLRKLDVHSRRDAVIAAERLRREEALGTKTPTAVR